MEEHKDLVRVEEPQKEIYTPKPAVPNSTGVLVLGIVSIVGCFSWGTVGLVCGIIALILHKKGMKEYSQAPDQFSDSSLSNLNAGRVCAIIGVILSSIMFLFLLAYVGTMFSVLFAGLLAGH